jgi:alpha-D-ribose 1-methylphosphonate 5-triphosphate diphosphatase
MDVRIERGQALIDGRFEETTIDVSAADGVIVGIGRNGRAPHRIDAQNLLVLPGIVDIHGDAFERQMMPRPGVDFPIDVALLESDRQAIANGITTVFHGVTWSWEPGLRGPKNARAILQALKCLEPRLAADTRFHLRHETYNLDAEAEIIQWLGDGRIDALAFNDHMSTTAMAIDRPDKRAQMAQRCGLSDDAFAQLTRDVARRADEVPGSIIRLAQAARASGVPLLSHDDASPEQRRWYRALGCRVAEFPVNEETAEEAASAGDFTVMGAPNVVRGGSHTGWVDATRMIARGLCSVLASDYYYPAPLLAALRLARDGVLPLERAWALVSELPARAVGLDDRGRIALGKRADLVLVDARDTERPDIVAVVAGGRIVHLAGAPRLLPA